MPETIEVKWNLPSNLFERVREEAERTSKPEDSVIAGLIKSALPPSGSEMDSKVREMMTRLSPLPDQELSKIAKSWMPAEEQARLTALLEKQNDQALTENEESELNELFERVVQISGESVLAGRILHDRQAQNALQLP